MCRKSHYYISGWLWKCHSCRRDDQIPFFWDGVLCNGACPHRIASSKLKIDTPHRCAHSISHWMWPRWLDPFVSILRRLILFSMNVFFVRAPALVPLQGRLLDILLRRSRPNMTQSISKNHNTFFSKKSHRRSAISMTIPRPA